MNKVQKYQKTKKGLCSKIYQNQKLNCRRRGRPSPTYTMIELREWMFSQKKFHVLFDNWKRLDFQKAYSPSVDRIDDKISYTMANIQLMTWEENNQKGYNSRRGRKLDDYRV